MDEDLDLTYDPERTYTDRELEAIASQMLKDDARRIDPDTGKPRGIGGENPILFEEHLMMRRKREIYTEVGVPDPSLVQGIYFRTHPQGRKINSEEARRSHGASFYK